MRNIIMKCFQNMHTGKSSRDQAQQWSRTTAVFVCCQVWCNRRRGSAAASPAAAPASLALPPPGPAPREVQSLPIQCGTQAMLPHCTRSALAWSPVLLEICWHIADGMLCVVIALLSAWASESQAVTCCCMHIGTPVGLGLLSSPVDSMADLASSATAPGSSGGVVATSSSAAAAQPAPSPEMSTASTLSPFAASLVRFRPLYSGVGQSHISHMGTSTIGTQFRPHSLVLCVTLAMPTACS